MKTIIKTTLKGNESITISQSVTEVYENLIDKGGFCLFDRVGSNGTSKMVIKKSVVKMVVQR